MKYDHSSSIKRIGTATLTGSSLTFPVGRSFLQMQHVPCPIAHEVKQGIQAKFEPDLIQHTLKYGVFTGYL